MAQTLLTTSVGAPALPALEDKALPSLGEGWEEETWRPKLPRPHSHANELQAGC